MVLVCVFVFVCVFVGVFVGVFVDVFVGVFVSGFVGLVANRGQLAVPAVTPEIPWRGHHPGIILSLQWADTIILSSS